VQCTRAPGIRGFQRALTAWAVIFYASDNINYETAKNPEILKCTHQMCRIFVFCSAACVYFVTRLISLSKTRRANIYVLPQMFFLERDLRAPSTGVKLCCVIVIFIMQIQIYAGPPHPSTFKKIGGQKHAKFGAIFSAIGLTAPFGLTFNFGDFFLFQLRAHR